MFTKNVVFFTVLFIFGYIQIGVIGLQCYDDIVKAKVTCNPTYANATRDNVNYTSIFVSNTNIVSKDYGCIALNKTLNGSIKTLRGCTYTNVTCKNATLNSMSISDRECKFCTTDLCNSGPQIIGSASALLLPLVISLFRF